MSTHCTRKPAIFDKPVLEINHRNITTKEFSDRLALKLKDYDALYAKDDANLRRAKEQTVRDFILEVIAKDYALKNGLSVSAEEVDKEVDKIRARYPDDNAFRRSLAQENMPFEDWRKSLEFTLLQRKVFESVSKNIPEIPEGELKEYYNNNKGQFVRPARVMLRQIVVEKEDDAKRILADLGNSGDFARLAKEFSVAPEGASGGNTGWIEKGTLDVFDQAFKMNVGARSKIIRSPYGFHIFEVLKKEPETHLSFADAKARIQRQLMERKNQAAFSSWLEQEVRRSTISKNDELIQAIKVSTRGN